jgi:hypothetical protein
MMVTCVCTQCGNSFGKERGQLNRALAVSPGRLFCSLKCAGLARRKPKLPLAERKAKKAAYDAIRRVQLADEIRAEKRERSKLTYTYEGAKAKREARKQRLGADHHTRYCRQYFAADPKRKARKVTYDRRRRDAAFGEFAACAKLLRELEALIRQRSPDKYERLKARGYYLNRPSSQERKRNAQCSRW